MKLIKLPILLSLFLVAILFNNSASAQCPAIVTQPVSVTVCEGVTVKFSVVTTVVTGRTYQWQQFDGVTWTNITGAPYTGYTTDTLTVVGSPGPLNGYMYRCIISKIGCSNITTNGNATLNLNFAPFINLSPKDSTTCLGANATFEVDAAGAGLTYQWELKVGSSWTTLSNLPPYSGVTTNKLLISSPGLALSGSHYRVSVGGTCPPSIISDSGTLYMLNVPQVTTQPTNASGCVASDVTFATAATGTGLAFQWQYDAGAGFLDLPGGLPYIGVYTNKLDITGVNGVTAAKNGWKFRCVVRGTCEPADTTNVVTLNVLSAPTISSVSVLDTLCAGENAEIDIVATGSGLKYNWSVDTGTGFFLITDGGVYAGAQTNKLKLTKIPSSFNGYSFRCFVEGVCPTSKYSGGVDMVVLEDKAVATQPHDTTVNVGINAEFSISTLGTNLSHRWQVDDGNGFQSIGLGSPYYSGVNTNILTVKNPTREMQGFKYRCLLYGGCDETPAASDPATLNVWWPATINNIAKDNDIIVYPNPATGSKLTIKSNMANADITSAKVIDHLGRTLISENVTLNNSREAELNIHSLPSGVYSVLLIDAEFNTVQTVRFTKQ